MSRVFTDQELEEMGAQTLGLLTKAIEAGDKEQAKKLASRMYTESLSMHDSYLDWLAGLMDYIYTEYGDDALYQALRKVFEAIMVPIMVNMRGVDFRRRAQGAAALIRGHQQPMKVEEDDEKVSITMEPCGSGQRLVEKGRYGPPCNFTMIQKPQPLTFSMTDFPVYCTHSPMVEMLSIEHLGYPALVCFPPDEKVARERSCTYCIYKNVEDIPEEVWTRIGRQKPKDL